MKKARPRKDKVDDPDSQKGYLKQKGYHPESVTTAEPEPRETADKDRDEPEPGLDYSGSKPPRPVPTVKEPKPSKSKKPKSQKVILPPAGLGPRMRRLYIARYCLVVCGLVILLASVWVSYQNHIVMSQEQDSLEKRGYHFMHDLRDYRGLTHEPETTSAAWDVNNFLTMTSDDIMHDLEPETEFMVEVRDFSSYPVKYNRTRENGQAWYSDDPAVDGLDNVKVFKISSWVNIYVSPDEVHLAKVTIKVWE